MRPQPSRRRAASGRSPSPRGRSRTCPWRAAATRRSRSLSPGVIRRQRRRRARRRRRHQHHDGRRLGDGHRQQPSAAADERRVDRRSQGAHLGLPGRIRPVSGVQVTAVTKSGTNRFRGSLYDVERDSDWNSNSKTNMLNASRSRSCASATGATRSADRSASRAATTSCSSSTARNSRRAPPATTSALPRADRARARRRLLADDR